jgi:hypothetical protein
MKKITAALNERGDLEIEALGHNPYSDTNILHRYRFEGQIQSSPSRDRVLCFDPKKCPGYINEIRRAWKRLSKRQRECLYGKYVIARMVKEDGNNRTAREVAISMRMSLDAFNQNVSRARRSITWQVRL